MYFLQASNNFFGDNPVATNTTIMLLITCIVIIGVAVFQRVLIQANQRIKQLEVEKEVALLQASIKFQEEERNRIAADLHDDAGPLLATVRLYLNDGFVNQDKAYQIQAIHSAKQIIDEAISLLRNISHKMMPPTLKNFGLESAAIDLFEKINGSGVVKASARFHDYKDRLTTENEMLAFRVIQELVNNILKHSHAGFIHLTQNIMDHNMYIRLQHDGKGITQKEFEIYSFNSKGLGLKNISSRIKVLKGKIHFAIDKSETFYRITMELPNDIRPVEDKTLLLV